MKQFFKKILLIGNSVPIIIGNSVALSFLTTPFKIFIFTQIVQCSFENYLAEETERCDAHNHG